MYMEFKNEMPRAERARRDNSSWLSAPVGSWRYYRIKESVQMLIISCKRRYYLAFKLASLEEGEYNLKVARNGDHVCRTTDEPLNTMNDDYKIECIANWCDKTQSEVRNAIHDTNLDVDTVYQIHGGFRRASETSQRVKFINLAKGMVYKNPVKRVGSSRKSYAGFLPKPIGQQRRK